MTGHLGLGSNVGDRRAHLEAAVAALRERGIAVTASSSTYDTDPVGEILDQPDFLNACKDVERALGRVPGGPRHGPRPIDVDLLLLGDREHSSERLTLPHAQVTERRFVLLPLVELDPDLRLPGGARLADRLAELPTDEGVRWAGPPLVAPTGD